MTVVPAQAAGVAEIAEVMRARHPDAPSAWDDAHDFLDAMKGQGVLEAASG